MVAEDRIYPSDNELEIPNLLLELQPRNGLLLPFAGWGITPRARRGVATYHFYVDDYRFSNIWQRPERLVQSGCHEVVEPNFSLFQTTPIAYGLQLLYKKRWIARWLQECGIRVWVDLNVTPKFRELNKLGVPNGYNAFATRGHEGELCPHSSLTEARCRCHRDRPQVVELRYHHLRPINERRIIIYDDIITTGSTLTATSELFAGRDFIFHFISINNR